MTKKTLLKVSDKKLEDSLFQNISTIWESTRSFASRSVNSAHSCAAWLIGRQLVESELSGLYRGTYGAGILKSVSSRLTEKYGAGFSISGLQYMRAFYVEYPEFISIQHAVRVESSIGGKSEKQHALRVNSNDSAIVIPDISSILNALRGDSDATDRKSPTENSNYKNLYTIHHPFGVESWKPGRFNPNLSWTHYRTLLKVKRADIRGFYEIESIKNGWSARQLERQIDSLLFERLLKSRDKKGVIALANKGQTVNKPIDIIKDPMILEFLDLPESHRLVETKVETALISKLKDFLLELGTGFAYVGRQKRLTLEGDHFYPDLVFYHIKLKCYVILDLKTHKLTHADLGQMQMYVHYYDREIRAKNENPTIGLILCTDKNDAVVKYVLDEKDRQIFATRYQHELPTVEELENELRREMELLSTLPPSPLPLAGRRGVAEGRGEVKVKKSKGKTS